MIIFIQTMAATVNSILSYKTVKKIDENLRIIDIILLLFQVIFVFPTLLEIFLGIPDLSSKSVGFDAALNDSLTNVIYNLLIIIIPLTLYFIGKYLSCSSAGDKDIRAYFIKQEINPNILTVFSVLMFTPLVLALFSPSPSNYFGAYAFFQQTPELASNQELWYHQKIMNLGGFISFIGILVTKIYSKNSVKNNIIIFLAVLITGFLNGKRTLLALIIFVILLVEILKTRKGTFPYRKIIVAGLFIVFAFIGYSFLIGKHTKGVSTFDNLRMYFFRDFEVKFSIYSLLNPNEYKILEYSGQSYLYNLVFFIPRILWSNKPYPYDIYLTASALGLPQGTIVSWNFHSSLFGEALANFSWIGVPFILFIVAYFVKVSEESENPVLITLCIFVITYSFMNHFGAYKNYLIVWILVAIIQKYKIFNKLLSVFKSDN